MAVTINKNNQIQMRKINFQDFFLESNLSDIEFKFPEEGKTIQAHRIILASTNEVFRNRFADIDNNNYKITIGNYNYVTFRAFLRYLYTSEFQNEDISEELLRCASEYSEKNLLKICEEELQKKIHTQNVGFILYAAINMKCEKLKIRALEYIARNYSEFTASNAELIFNNKLLSKEISGFVEEFCKNPSECNKSTFNFRILFLFILLF